MRLEFAFTQHDTPALRARIEGDLTRVAARAHAVDPHLRALVLTGGFSRGEGSAQGDVPLNDYDLLAVRDRPGHGPYPSLHRALSRELGIEVDLLPVWRARLPHVGRKLFWLDVRLGARVIAGDPQALAGVRRFHQVDPGEVARLLGNRAAGLLLSLPGAGESPDPAQRDLQATKAVLAAMDATLLHEGRYAGSMRERLRRTVAHPDHRVYAKAVAWKLDPRTPLPPAWWDLARDALLAAVRATRAHERHDGPAEVAMHLLRAKRLSPSPSQAVRRRAWDLLRGCSWPDGPLLWREEKARFFAARARTLQ